VRLAGGDVVDIRQFLVHRVDVVEAERSAGLLHRNRAARLVFALLLFLGGAGPALRLGVGAEVTAARRGAAGRAAAGIERTRAAAAEGAGWPRREAAAGRRTGKAAGTRTAGAAIFTGARFADRQRPPVEHLTVESLNRLFGVRAVGKFHERKPTRTSGLAVDRQHDLRRRSDGSEVAPQIRFGGAVCEITDEQTNGQSTLS